MGLRKEILGAQQELEEQLRREVRESSTDYASVREYEREYTEETKGFRFRRERHLSSLEALLREISTRRSVLIGDFHTFGGAKNLAIMILERLAVLDPPRKIILGLEYFSTDQQHLLDAYLAGEIVL